MLKNDTVLTLRACNVLTTQGHKIYKNTKLQFKTIDKKYKLQDCYLEL